MRLNKIQHRVREKGKLSTDLCFNPIAIQAMSLLYVTTKFMVLNPHSHSQVSGAIVRIKSLESSLYSGQFKKK